MNFRPLLFLILCIVALLTVGDLSAQEQKKETEGSKIAQVEKQQAEDKKPTADKEPSAKGEQQKNAVAEEKSDCVLIDLEMKDICGKTVNLKKYEGKVVLIVNVASKCGFTGQYKPLQALYNEFNPHGLEVVAFPCNQFGKQEPHDERLIDAFCKEKYGIKFDLFAKVKVKGNGQAELFKRLTCCELKPAGKGPIQWNFEKFVIGKDGKPFARFRSNVAPDDERIVSTLKSALGIMEAEKEKVEPASGKESETDKKKDAVEKDAQQKKASEDKQDKKS